MNSYQLLETEIVFTVVRTHFVYIRQLKQMHRVRNCRVIKTWILYHFCFCMVFNPRTVLPLPKFMLWNRFLLFLTI